MIKLIDVSEHQGTITEAEWRRVKAAGYDGAFIKVSEGDYLDPKAERNAHGAKAAGLIVGGYDFLRPGGGRRGTRGELEWEIFQRHAMEIGLLRKGCLRPSLDVEATKLDAVGTRAYVRSWVAEAFEDLGKHPIIYTGNWFWSGERDPRKQADEIRRLGRYYMHTPGAKQRRYGCKLWLAAYVGKDDVKHFIPKAWNGRKSFWQYTDKGTVPGIDGHVDLNVYGSTMRNLKRAHTL